MMVSSSSSSSLCQSKPEPQNLLNVSGQYHSLAILPPKRQPPVRIHQIVDWTSLVAVLYRDMEEKNQLSLPNNTNMSHKERL